jgi:tRNA (guanine26-N2/guanine27-N2)-dimethyltransferase
LSFDFPTETMNEGSASILVPRLSLYKLGQQYVPSLAPVFYNPRMRLNRDIAVLTLRAFQRKRGQDISVAEPLAGSGIRGIRFAKEVPGVLNMAMNDLNPSAARLMERNVADNAVSGKAVVTNLDANTFLAVHAAPGQRFDFVDIDPYGSPSPFLENAFRSLNNRGMLAGTATDTAPLCGVNPAACIRTYQGRPLRTEYCRELGIRLILNAVVWAAARRDLGIDVLLSYASDHYLRVYVQVNRGARHADESIDQLGYVLHCFSCMHRTWVKGIVPKLDMECPDCGRPMSVAGPLWLGPIVDREFCNEALQGLGEGFEDRAPKLLGTLAEEAGAPMTFYVIDKVCDRLGLRIPPRRKVIEELLRRGCFAGRTHFDPAGLKTDAPVKTLREVLAQLAAGS